MISCYAQHQSQSKKYKCNTTNDVAYWTATYDNRARTFKCI